MPLRHKIPRTPSSEYPFLEEVDFEKLRMKLAGRALTQPVKGAVPEPANDTGVDFHHIVNIQSKLERLGMILSSSQANSALITGPHGGGKTILVEALLRARAENRLTSQLTSKPFFIFDPNSFATAAYGANPVKKFDECLTLADQRNGLVIIDHFDDLLKTAGSEMAATLTSTLGKHLEGNRDFQVVLTSEDSKEKYVLDSSAGIARQIEKLELGKEPDDAELKKILIAKFNSLEKAHNVNFTEEAADEIIRLLTRYPAAAAAAFPKARPANAIKFADKVATYVRLNKYAEPLELVESREKVRLLQDQSNLIANDISETAVAQREKLEKEIGEQTAAYAEKEAVWKKKFEPLFKARAAFQELESQLHMLRNNANRSLAQEKMLNIYANNYDVAKQRIDAEEKALYPTPPSIETRHIRWIFSQESNISASTLSEDRLEHLSKLDAYLDGEIVRQAGPKKALASAYFQRETGISDPSRPAGVFLFLGGTGLGKTELAKALARFDAGEGAEPVIIRLSEFKGKEAGKKMTGADPGLVGYEDGSCFDAVGKNPRAIVLLDEAEKCDPSVFDVAMQILEEGKITPSNSKAPIEFKDTIVLLASNALKASDFSKDELQDEALIRERLKKVLNPDTGTPQFKPEFIGRIDRVFVFEDLEPNDHVQIFRKEMRKVNRDYAGRGISISVDDDVAAKIIKLHDDPTIGGRLSRHIVGKHIRPLLTDYLKQHIKEVMDEKVKFKAQLTLQLDGSTIVVQPARPHTSPALHPANTELHA